MPYPGLKGAAIFAERLRERVEAELPLTTSGGLAVAYDGDTAQAARALDEARLNPAYTGIRPKIVGPGDQAADFVLQGPAQHGVTGLVNLFGIESPGLTAALAIGQSVDEMLG